MTAIFFDILHADGEDLIDHVEPDRWRRLTEFFTADSVVRREELSDPEEVDAFFGEALAAGHARGRQPPKQLACRRHVLGFPARRARGSTGAARQGRGGVGCKCRRHGTVLW